MTRTRRPWRGVAPLVLTGLMAPAGFCLADEPPVSEQLVGLARQALAQGHRGEAASFLSKALELDPQNAAAEELGLQDEIRLVALQDQPGTPPPPAPGAGDAASADQPGTSATLDAQAQSERVVVQQLTNDIRERQQRARDYLNAGDAQSALDTLRLGVNSLSTADRVPESVRRQLTRELQAQIQSTVRREEELELQQAEQYRLRGSSEQQMRDLAQAERVEYTVKALMDQFDALMSKGVYNVLFNGGSGNIAAATAPFFDARLVAQQARALKPWSVSPWAGIAKSQYEGFLAQALQFEALKEYRFMLTLQDVDRAAVPFPDTITIEYPPADHWREISEKRIRRYESTSLEAQDSRTLAIQQKLKEPLSMPFTQETPLEDVLKYIQSATQSTEMPGGIPIYVDPAGLLEAEKTLQSPITLNLEGVPLRQSLRLILRQLDLNYTVKEGLMTITYVGSRDQPTEIRVYPVADLALIPTSLIMGGGGGGGMGGGGMGGGGMGGGGMGGGGMGGGGMGGGGMGGGGGGMGGGGMGGFGSVPVVAPLAQDPAGVPGSFEEKKSS